MEVMTIFLIALSLAMDAFAVSIANGVSVTHFSRKEALKQGIYFGLFQFLMPLLGWVLGISIKNAMEAIDHWITFFLLALIGGSMIWESLKQEEQKNITVLTNKNLVLQAIATSIDALAIGVSFAILQVNIVFASVIIGAVAFILSYIGGMLGKHLGEFLQKKASIAGGIVLIVVGFKILLEHMQMI
ncbi:manganese efflux pump MntP family protein [Clostridium sp. MD294]|uniref:manganese efflux pump MntP n=1 Tax=Clostridium sp. MD294 TaxID=97138 RepID=UPI0002CB9984|nr:manganese efflux pump MntP family protein [Clostridium sp. MD294]NDO46628.1 manganese efflux pump [Clostridium sp. MD294]USF28939.1 putative manganese efflux pump MntP [Clostridium sp. MD294]